MLRQKTKTITKLVIDAAKAARKEIPDSDIKPAFTTPITWPVNCLVGPGLEGAIACKSKVGYVNGSTGGLIYRGYDIFDLCAYSTFEEVSSLLITGQLPTASQLKAVQKTLTDFRNIPTTIGLLMNFPLKGMNPMAGLRLGVNLLRQEFALVDAEGYEPTESKTIGSDEDSIPMETHPRGERHAIYEFKTKLKADNQIKASYRILAAASSLAGTVSRQREGRLPIEPLPELSYAGNLIYMITGKKPTPTEERIMDIALILHADHGMNASTFASMVVASTLSDIYSAIEAGIAALNGPLHGGANKKVLTMLNDIGDPKNVKAWYKRATAKKQKIMGFGHRVYKAYDPRARILGPLAEFLVKKTGDDTTKTLFATAERLEKEVVGSLGKTKKIFPNVDFYSGLVYSCLGIPIEMFTPLFAVSRISGWTARVLEYLGNNRIFRPRAVYIGPFDTKYVPLNQRLSEERDKKMRKR